MSGNEAGVDVGISRRMHTAQEKAREPWCAIKAIVKDLDSSQRGLLLVGGRVSQLALLNATRKCDSGRALLGRTAL